MTQRITQAFAINSIYQGCMELINRCDLYDCPQNLIEKSLENLINSYIKSIQILAGDSKDDKPSGKIKIEVLNRLRISLNLKFETDISDYVEKWEESAKIAYKDLYSCRTNPKELYESASRIMRGFDLFSPLPEGQVKIHYKPSKEIVRRFYSQIVLDNEVAQFVPSHIEGTGTLIGLNCEPILIDLNEVTVDDYKEGKIEALPKIDIERIGS